MTGRCSVVGVRLGIMGPPGVIGVIWMQCLLRGMCALVLFPPGYTDTVCLVRVATANDGPMLRPVATADLLMTRRFGHLNIWRHVLMILDLVLVLTMYLLMKRVARMVLKPLKIPFLVALLTPLVSWAMILRDVGTQSGVGPDLLPPAATCYTFR